MPSTRRRLGLVAGLALISIAALSSESQAQEPLEIPFPPTNVGPETPAPAPVAGTPEGCKPTNLFYGLCLLDSSDLICLDVGKVAEEFRKRRYRTRVGSAGKSDLTNGTKANTLEEMIKSVATALSWEPAFCKCSGDQLVLYVSTHGQKCGGIDYAGDVNGSVPYRDFTALLSDPLKGVDPKKVYLILVTCRSGQIFEGGIFPPSLKGIHILASSPADANTKPTFTPAALAALQDKTSKSWFDFVKKLKEKTQTTQPIPINGDLAAKCRVVVRVKEITYKGVQFGATFETVISLKGKTWTDGRKFADGLSVTPADAVILDALWDEPIELDLKIQSDTSGASGSESLAKKYKCNEKKTETVEVKLDDGAGKTATVTYKLEIETTPS